MNGIVKHTIRSFAAFLLAVMLIIALQHYWLRRERHLAAARQTQLPIPTGKYLFSTSITRHKTCVPFSLYKNAIIITALINGRPTECEVDTGSSHVSWRADKQFTHQRTGTEILLGDNSGHKVRLQEALLDSIQIGDLKFGHLPSYVVPSSLSAPNAVTILGNIVFAHMALTIDYVKQELTIQPSVQNTVPLGVVDHRYVLDFQCINPNTYGSGVPCLQGKVMSLPVGVIIDTGLLSYPISITHTLYGRLLPRLKSYDIRRHTATDTFSFSKAKITTLDHIPLSFAGVSFEGTASVVTTCSPPAQAVVGYGFLKNYRTTIDYGQNKVWLEENRPGR